MPVHSSPEGPFAVVAECRNPEGPTLTTAPEPGVTRMVAAIVVSPKVPASAKAGGAAGPTASDTDTTAVAVTTLRRARA